MTQAPETTAPIGLDLSPTSGYTGAEISGVDLRGPLDAATVAELRAALLRYKVIFFRDQRIGHAEQIAFARLFGKVTPAHPHEDNPPEGFPEILPIDSRRYEARLGRKRTSYDNSWHTDVTPLVNPPAASILRAELLPPYGGDTAFTNLVAAYENLPQGLRDLADTLKAKHAFASRAKPGSQRDNARAAPAPGSRRRAAAAASGGCGPVGPAADRSAPPARSGTRPSAHLRSPRPGWWRPRSRPRRG